MLCRRTAIISFLAKQKNIVHADCLVWCHCELIGVQSDNFKVGYTLDDKAIIKERHIPSSIFIGDDQSYKSGKSGSSFFKEPPTFNVDKSGVCDKGFARRAFPSTKPMTRSATAAGASAKTPPLGKKISPLQSRVLECAYKRCVLRSKSVKAAKRKAAEQDSSMSM